MKLHLIIGTGMFLMLAGCAHSDATKPGDGMNTSSKENSESTCVPPKGKDKCTTGGGLTGPIVRGQATTSSQENSEASCVPPPGKDKCVTGGGLTGPIVQDN